MQENYQSDIKVRVRFVSGGTVRAIPSHDFMLRFRTAGAPYGTWYDCWRKGGEWHNCSVDTTDPTVLVCSLDDPGLSPGELVCELFDYVPDTTFADGTRLVVTPCGLGMTLTPAAGAGVDDVLDIGVDAYTALTDTLAVGPDGLFYTDAAGNIALRYTPADGFDVARVSDHFLNLLASAVGGGCVGVVVSDDGLYYSDAAGNVALSYTASGLDAAVLSEHFKALVREAVRTELTSADGFFYADASGNTVLRYTPADGLDAARVSDHLKQLIKS